MKFERTGVYLYTHWGGRSLPETVRKALARGERWGDTEYLARLVFQQMVGDDDSATGYGIGSQQHGDVSRVVKIDTSEQEVTLVNESRHYDEDEGMVTDATNSETFEFDEFVNQEVEWPEWPEARA